MGLLDDAIREHLELKRRHGADPGEIEQQEREALGEEPREEPVAEAEAPVADEPQPELPADATTVMEPAAADEIEPPAPEEIGPDPEADAPGREEDPWLVEEEADAPPEPEAQRPAGEEDVLEETPEFLQETPEHERLWFEQKPPRDFDWDR